MSVIPNKECMLIIHKFELNCIFRIKSDSSSAEFARYGVICTPYSELHSFYLCGCFCFILSKTKNNFKNTLFPPLPIRIRQNKLTIIDNIPKLGLS